MNFSKKIVEKELLIGGMGIALERGMHREDEVTSVQEGDEAMTVTGKGINSGNVRVMYGEMSMTRHKYFYLNDELLFEEQYNRSGDDWETEPTITVALREDAVLYKM
jgi:hypothetical protein